MEMRQVMRLMGSAGIRDGEDPHAALAAALAPRWGWWQEALWRVRMALWRCLSPFRGEEQDDATL